MKILLTASLVIILVILTGCQLWNTVQTTIAVRGADAADETLESALWTICNGVPVGAINRRFKTADEITAYQRLCPGSQTAPGSPDG